MIFASFFNRIFNKMSFDVKTGSTKIIPTCYEERNAQVYSPMYLTLKFECGASVALEAITCYELYQQLKKVCLVKLKGTYTMRAEDIFDSMHYTIYFGMKPLRNDHIPLSEYNLIGGEILTIKAHLCIGGSKIILPTYQVVSECERDVINTITNHIVIDYQLQSGDFDEERQRKAISAMMHHVLKGLKNLPPLGLDANWFIKQIENFSILTTFARKCECFTDYYALTQMAYRLFTGEVLSMKVDKMVARLFETEVQSFDTGEALNYMRQAFDGVTQITESALSKRLVSLYSYLLTQGYLKTFGITLSDEDYSKMEQRALLNAFSSKKSFYVCIIDTVLFIAERIHEYSVTGDISTFVHSSSKYTKWLKEADRVINLAPFTGNLQAHGTSYFSYIADLRELCEQGNAYSKYLRSSSGVEASIISKKLSTLQMLANTEITRRAAMKERAQPMGVLVYGHSSIAKSAFTKMLFNYYGSLFDLERGDDFRYVRNPMDEYWSNFDSSKWCIQLDDIAFKHPGKCSDIDSTLQDLLNVVNNVPYVPPQASLEDKGKTPVLAELVIATTNCETLNAQEYFWCPLAVRRRLPFVISLKPKDEYLHENQAFIDPLKIKIDGGCFPDLWEITVKAIVPNIQYGREMVDLKVVETFTDVRKFLQYFGKACKQHKLNQKRAMSSDVEMRTIDVCRKCYMPLPHDQCVEIQSLDTTWFFMYALLNNIVNWVCAFAIFWKGMDYLVSKRFCTAIAFRIANKLPCHDKVVAFYGRYAEFRRSRHGGNLCTALSVLSMLLGSYYAYTVVTNKINKPTYTAKDQECNTSSEVEDECTIEEDEPLDMTVQGNRFGTVEEQLEKEEKTNVWYNPTIELTTFDVPTASASLANITPEKLHHIFSKNCVMLRIRLRGDSSVRIIRGTFIKGHICVTNGHAFKSMDAGSIYDVTIVQSNVCEGLNSNIVVVLSIDNIAFSTDTDLCVFQVDSIPPFKDITKFWQSNVISPSSCVELIRQPDGSVEKRSIYGLSYMPNMPVDEMPNATYNIHFGMSDQITEVGLCGSLCIAITPRGPIIIGFHMLGAAYRVGVLHIEIDQINVLLESKKLSQRPVVQSGFQPSLECESRKHTLGPIHHKSLVRYIEVGTANVYGSFEGFRPKPKSKVCGTPLQHKFLAHYDTEVNYDKPVMSGWEPWRKNVVEMVKPNVTHKENTLRACVRAFSDDIIRELPTGWEKDLIFLSDEASVNGLPGVIYIDGINRNSSMGFPWCKSKAGFLREMKTERFPDGVDFTPEVWEKVRKVEESYRAGRRAYPIFTGHLKDEATSLVKCEMKKTRLFTGAPIDWSLVVRKKLLSFVRLVQKNKFTFEAGPGVVCQSSEWGRVYKYLTRFGEDQMVAGDYGKFDKRMTANFVLAAFEVIVNVYRAAGFPEDELREIMCIGEDTAFPLCNINGDLLEFFGTNPSGHPLTVIINSLANALYMRYCYFELNPNKEVDSFKHNVSLFTYGDDNVFGVNKNIPWYNHTTIQSVLHSIGVEYTMADKTSESKPYIHIQEVSFLKREWVWNGEVGGYLCPLDEESIIKSLTVWVPSGTIDKYKQMVAVMTSANNEYFFYGREKFEKEHTFLKSLLEIEPYCYYADTNTLPSFDELAERWRRASGLDRANDLE